MLVKKIFLLKCSVRESHVSLTIDYCICNRKLIFHLYFNIITKKVTCFVTVTLVTSRKYNQIDLKLVEMMSRFISNRFILKHTSKHVSFQNISHVYSESDTI